MSDTISRQAAIDEVERSRRLNIHQEWKAARDHECEHRHFLKILVGLPPAQPEQRWIPVTERLPEAGVRYQVTFESGEVGYADFRNKIFLSDGSAKENVWKIERYYEEDGEVIAWMPLPAPYTERRDNDQMC